LNEDILQKISVLVCFFNRPNALRRVLDSIKHRKDIDLYLAADGPRDLRDSKLIDQCWKELDSLNYAFSVKETLMSKENRGCKFGMVENIDWFFSNTSQGLILEDDCVPNDSFIDSINSLLNSDVSEKIMTISGTSYNLDSLNEKNYNFRLSKFLSVWGWGSWASSWKNYDLNIPDISEVIQNASNSIYGEGKSLDKMYFEKIFTHRFKEVQNGTLDTWDYSLLASSWRNNYLNLQSNFNSIINIGFTAEATHTSQRKPGWVSEHYDSSVQKSYSYSNYNNQQDQVIAKKVYGCNLKNVSKEFLKQTIRGS